MKTREILEKIRKGELNERTIGHMLIMLNEKCNANEKNLALIGKGMDQLSELIGLHTQVMSGMSGHLDNFKKRFGMENSVGSEDMRMPEDTHKEG